MCVCVCLEQSRNWRKANPSWSGKFADSILSRLVLVTTVLSLRWLPSLCDQQCQHERASGGSWWEESALSTAWNSIPLLPRFLFLSSGNLLDHHFGPLRSRPGYLGQRGAAPGVAFGFLFPEQSLRWKCCTSLGQIFFFPPQRSRDNSVSWSLIFTFQCVASSPSRWSWGLFWQWWEERKRVFLASQSIVEERHVCRHPHQCQEPSQAFLGEEALFVLDVLC